MGMKAPYPPSPPKGPYDEDFPACLFEAGVAPVLRGHSISVRAKGRLQKHLTATRPEPLKTLISLDWGNLCMSACIHCINVLNHTLCEWV